MDIPIIRIEIERMKHSLAIALAEYAALMDSEVQRAVDEFCTPENINRVVKQHATAAINEAIRDAVDKFFRCGGGVSVIRDTVEKELASRIGGAR